ncbi:hypothetical protein [Dyella sp.]|uniref:hypothetical protein n=1 Tax=Dyella sp. TaxID=1869338 RepID=UPI002ED428B2
MRKHLVFLIAALLPSMSLAAGSHELAVVRYAAGHADLYSFRSTIDKAAVIDLQYQVKDKLTCCVAIMGGALGEPIKDEDGKVIDGSDDSRALYRYRITQLPAQYTHNEYGFDAMAVIRTSDVAAAIDDGKDGMRAGRGKDALHLTSCAGIEGINYLARSDKKIVQRIYVALDADLESNCDF